MGANVTRDDALEATADAVLFARAAKLVNPNSGLASDYLNVFYELLLLIENLPIIPEMVDDLVQWQPISYTEYFQRSRLPGSAETLAIYERQPGALRIAFDLMIATVNTVALAGIANIDRRRDPQGDIAPGAIAELCAEIAADLKTVLALMTSLVDNGMDQGICENAQLTADRFHGAKIAVG